MYFRAKHFENVNFAYKLRFFVAEYIKDALIPVRFACATL